MGAADLCTITFFMALPPPFGLIAYIIQYSPGGVKIKRAAFSRPKESWGKFRNLISRLLSADAPHPRQGIDKHRQIRRPEGEQQK